MSALQIVVQGIGNPPSFKNSKMIVQGRGHRRAMLITDPKKRRWMDKATESLKSQLLLACQTTEGATSTESLQRFLTASCPQDDSWQFVPVLKVTMEKVPKGEEGASIIINSLP